METEHKSVGKYLFVNEYSDGTFSIQQNLDHAALIARKHKDYIRTIRFVADVIPVDITTTVQWGLERVTDAPFN